MRALALLLGLLAALPAAADAVDEIAKKVIRIAGEASALADGLGTANGLTTRSGDELDRRLVEGQVLHGVGNYADAAIILLDIVDKHPEARGWREAVWLLGDSLFQHGDNLTAREQFHRIIDEFGDSDPHYQEALERLVELTIRLKDEGRITDYLARLDRIPQHSQLPSIPYVRGKVDFHAGRYDDAIRAFSQIGPSSPFHLQARYFIGAAYLAKGESASALKAFDDLSRQSVAADDKDGERILELAHLAMGRIYYDRDQPTEAIDHYLMVSRKSDLFDESLFEVTWVYVKAKQFDKALRALELLALANAKSAMLPEVRILEGNLRIRKAQTLAANDAPLGSTHEEFTRAAELLLATRDEFQEPRLELERLLGEENPNLYAALVGSAPADLDVTIPPLAIDWARREPEIGRVMAVSATIEQIRAEIVDTERAIGKLERAITSPSRVSIFPSLADRRGKLQELVETLQSLRQQLATHERALVLRHATPEDLAALKAVQEQRAAAARRVEAIPATAKSRADRIAEARAAYDNLGKNAQQFEAAIYSIEAEITGLERFYAESPGTKMPAEVFNKNIAELRGEAAALRGELDLIRADIDVAADEAGIGDELTVEALAARADLDAATGAEHRAMLPVLGRMSGADRQKAEQIQNLLGKMDQAGAVLAQTNARIDGILDAQLAEVQISLAAEKARLGEIRATLKVYEGEASEVGAAIVRGALGAVHKKFYDIAIRADVGVIDVAWAKKEIAEERLDRLRQDRASERNVLDADFRDVLVPEEGTGAP